ncbi:hypothetical protein NFI96_000403 [Prochilodus magdalenae]|nr:hypothetical protein NFI96_000403 [Prochilodus magdalenae]
MTVWYDSTAVFGDGDVVLRTVVVTVCVHVVLRGAAVCRWCCTNRMTHGGHHCSLEVCNGGCWVSQGIMAAAVLLFLTVTSVCLGVLSASTLINVDCRPAAGVAGQPTKISCSFKKNFGGDHSIIISAVTVMKKGERDPVFQMNGEVQEGARFNLPSTEDPSLQITNTAVSDEGQYDYMVVTNRGIIPDGTFQITVTAKYGTPTINSRPEKLEEGASAEFHCTASGGYPAGAIHWFDSTGTNWTKSATLDITEGEDKLLKLSSTLSFTSIDSNWGKFKCVVLNSKFSKEGEIMSTANVTGGKSSSNMFSDETSPLKLDTKVVAPVVVIGSLIVGLLLVLLVCRKRSKRYHDIVQATGANAEMEKGQSECRAENSGEGPFGSIVLDVLTV